MSENITSPLELEEPWRCLGPSMVWNQSPLLVGGKEDAVLTFDRFDKDKNDPECVATK